jgi:hypothetical protein
MLDSMPSADTSNTERIRRLRAKTIAVAVAAGVPLPVGRGYDAVEALRLGRSAAIVETPGGPVTEPGCGCSTVTPVGRTFTCSSLSGPYPVTDSTIFLDIVGSWSIVITYFDGESPKPNEVPPSQNESGSGPTAIVLKVPNGAVNYSIGITCVGGQIITLNCTSSGSITSLPASVDIVVLVGTSWELTYPDLTISLGTDSQLISVSQVGTYSLACV